MNLNKLLLEVLRYYNINKNESIPYRKELKRLSSLNELKFENLVFPYEFVEEYEFMELVEVHKDNEGVPFVLLGDDRKLFFPRSWNYNYIIFMFRLIGIEQCPNSPHFYKPIPKNSDITLDIGCAEANFTLFNLNKSKEFHLFDTELFLEPIMKTFKENNNVIYHTGLVNNKNKIDDISFNDGKVDNIKIDVEGDEYNVLIGAEETIHNDKPDIQVCVYHSKDQFEKVYTLLKSFGYKNIKCSKGYMLFPNSYQEPPYFRKGVLYASNH